MSLLEIEGLNVDVLRDGEMHPVVRDVSFSIDAGEALGLVGESGSGKTMTARAITQLLPEGARMSGRISFDGQDIGGASGKTLRRFRAQDVGMVFQDPRAAINPMRRVGAFLVEGLRETQGVGSKEATRRAVEQLDAVRIADPERCLRCFPHELSGGMLQRVMIAAALLTGPRLLLADEPTTALDVTTQAEIVGILDHLRRERGLAMLFISHDLELARAVTGRTAVMFAGEIVETQASQALHSEPLHPYTAALIASRPRVEHRLPRLAAIPGRALAAFEAPDGCAFQTRCAYSVDACRAEQPLGELAPGAAVRCCRSAELHDELRAQANPPIEDEAYDTHR
jgi:oligopeptide/dipeptide ABC transporter ATP-binding protein